MPVGWTRPVPPWDAETRVLHAIVESEMAEQGALELWRPTDVAEGLEQARPGQALVVGPNGEVVGPLSREVVAATLAASVAVILPASLLFIVSAVLFGNLGVLASLMACLIVGAVWAQPRFELDRAVKLHGAGDLAKAEWTARRVAVTGFASLMVRGNAWMIAGAAAWLQGDLDKALKWMRKAVEDLGAPRKGSWRGVAALARLNEVQLMAIRGDLVGAKAKLDDLERDGMPGGDLVQIELMHARLVLAFEAGNAKMLPADELGDWMRAVLRTNRFGSTLVLLAWAHVKRGDLELVPMMLEIAEDRLAECRLEHSHPKLERWLQSRRQRMS
jgi:hypothetical protein